MTECVISELVLDFDLYPRTSVDTQHVAYMKEACKAGCEFPPIVADAKTKRVTDGFHRTKMYSSLFGPSHKVDVVFKRYKSEREMFVDACRYNATHGRTLTTCDRARCAILGERLQVDTAALAEALHINPKTLETLRLDRTAVAPNGKGLHVPLKRTIQHKAGQTLTQQQADANDKLGGMQQTFYVNQLITLIENDLLDLANTELVNRLEILRKLLAAVKL